MGWDSFFPPLYKLKSSFKKTAFCIFSGYNMHKKKNKKKEIRKEEDIK